MNEKQILDFCNKHNISVLQYFLLYMTKERWQGKVKEYRDFIARNEIFSEDLQSLLDKKFIVKTNSDPALYPDFIRVSDKFEEVADNMEMAEELFTTYPATFPLAGGGTFIARTGMEKEKMLKLYLAKIGHSPEKHRFVMEQLRRYIRLANTGRTNGNKLSVFIENEMWDAISQIPDAVPSTFKDDI